MQVALAQTLHLCLLNHGVLLTPLHNMMLLSPCTASAAVERLLTHFDAGLDSAQRMSGIAT